MEPPGYIRAESDGILLLVKLQPRASGNQIVGPLGGELRVRVTAPPVDAAASEALLLLVKILDSLRSRVQLVCGQTSRHKAI